MQIYDFIGALTFSILRDRPDWTCRWGVLPDVGAYSLTVQLHRYGRVYGAQLIYDPLQLASYTGNLWELAEQECNRLGQVLQQELDKVGFNAR